MDSKEYNKYDLEERTFIFAKDVAIYLKDKLKHPLQKEYAIQLTRSSGSVGANYIEANESLGKKDFLMHLRICLKEAKESAYWLRLMIETSEEEDSSISRHLLNEAFELKKIFAAIINKSV